MLVKSTTCSLSYPISPTWEKTRELVLKFPSGSFAKSLHTNPLMGNSTCSECPLSKMPSIPWDSFDCTEHWFASPFHEAQHTNPVPMSEGCTPGTVLSHPSLPAGHLPGPSGCAALAHLMRSWFMELPFSHTGIRRDAALWKRSDQNYSSQELYFQLRPVSKRFLGNVFVWYPATENRLRVTRCWDCQGSRAPTLSVTLRHTVATCHGARKTHLTEQMQGVRKQLCPRAARGLVSQSHVHWSVWL